MLVIDLWWAQSLGCRVLWGVAHSVASERPSSQSHSALPHGCQAPGRPHSRHQVPMCGSSSAVGRGGDPVTWDQLLTLRAGEQGRLFLGSAKAM